MPCPTTSCHEPKFREGNQKEEEGGGKPELLQQQAISSFTFPDIKLRRDNRASSFLNKNKMVTSNLLLLFHPEIWPGLLWPNIIINVPSSGPHVPQQRRERNPARINSLVSSCYCEAVLLRRDRERTQPWLMSRSSLHSVACMQGSQFCQHPANTEKPSLLKDMLFGLLLSLSMTSERSELEKNMGW